jgi:PiT family inorganic phosphate transporter
LTFRLLNGIVKTILRKFKENLTKGVVMDISFSYFAENMAGNPILIVTVLLTLGVIFVNGWTDAPNAIATCVTTRCLSPRKAILMSAAFNFLGVFIMTQINSSVASTISNMVDFGDSTHSALIALCAALVSIVVYSVAASVFGIPTSESHSLIAGLSGAAIAIQQGIGGINGSEWVKVIYGLVLSLVLGFATGWIVCRLITILCREMDRRKTNRFFSWAQIAGAAAMSFMHGAQDGQKFIGVLFLGIAFANGQGSVTGMEIPLWLMLLCSIVMGLGTSVGGEKIIKSVGMDMVKLERYQGFAADLSGALCLLYSSLFGIPVSTTHTKTSAIMGVGAVKRLSAINFGVVKDMMLTWIFTFPGCGLISFVMAKIFMFIFG